MTIAKASTIPIIDVLTSVPVEGALFTTYTLSLAWFETYLLRSLDRAGAKQLLLLADPIGINASLGEGLVKGPGVRYSIEPVEAPKGAFHSKVAFLWSSESLVLAVGSGNMTFAGMHRNLECWEVLTAGVATSSSERLLHRGVAEDARAFLEHLRTSLDPGGRAVTILSSAIACLTSWLPRLSSEASSVRWFDSTKHPIGEQVAAHLGRGNGRRLQVLSPFHDRDGKSIDQLASKLGASNVDVLFTGTTTTYPLATTVTSNVETRRLDHEDQDRRLHAKVFHIVDATDAHVLSGSANATWQALWTTNNIEVSLLRRGAFGSLLPTVAGTPTVDFVEYKAPQRSLLTIQWARATGSDVRSHVRWSGDAPPTQILVGFVDSLEDPVSVDWPADGVVRVALPAAFNSLRLRALRIEVVAVVDDRRWVARSWIAFDEVLNSSKEFRAALSAWNRLLAGGNEGDDDEDDAVLLRIFAEEHVETINALGNGTISKARAHVETEQSDDGDVSIPLRLIDALTRIPIAAGVATSNSTASIIDDVERAMRIAFGVLGERAQLEDEEDDEIPGGKRSKRPRRTLSRAVRQALDDFEEGFVEAAAALKGRPAQPAQVLAYSTLCMRLVIRYRLRDGERPAAFWSSTARLVRTILCPSGNRAPLVSLLHAPGTTLADDAAQLLALLLALLAWHDAGGRLDGEGASRTQPMRADIIREALAALERAAESNVSCGELPRSLDDVFPDPPERLPALIDELRKQPAPSERVLSLKNHLDALQRGETVSPASAEPERTIVRDARHTSPLFVEPWITTCPRCHQSLAPGVRTRLLVRTPTQCFNTRCSRWLIPSEGA